MLSSKECWTGLSFFVFLSPQQGQGQRCRLAVCWLDGVAATAKSTLFHTAVFHRTVWDFRDKCQDLDLNIYHSLTSRMYLSTCAEDSGCFYL